MFVGEPLRPDRVAFLLRVGFFPCQGGLSDRPPLTSFGSPLSNKLEYIVGDVSRRPRGPSKLFWRRVREEPFAGRAKGSSRGAPASGIRKTVMLPAIATRPRCSYEINYLHERSPPFGRVWEGALGSKASSHVRSSLVVPRHSTINAALTTVMRPSSTVRVTSSPRAMLPRRSSSLMVSSTVRWIRRRRGRAPYLGS